MKRKLHSLAMLVMIVMSIFTFSQTLVAQTQRNLLIEFCTGTWCQWCPCGDYTIENLLAAHPNLIPLAYHGPVGQDPYSYFQGNEILSTFGFGGYPTGTVDRASGTGDYTSWTSKVNSRVNVPATVSIDIEKSFNRVTGQLDATIYMTALENLTGQYKYNIVLTEDSLIYNQVNNQVCVPGNGQNWVHNWVVRAMINGYTGEAVNSGSTWNLGDMISKTISYNVSSAYNEDKCNLVVFVYKQNSPMYLAQVQQAEQWTLIAPDYIAAISSSSPDVIVSSSSDAEFSAVLHNQGLQDDTYNITASIDGPAGWMGEFTTENGTFPFGNLDSVHVTSGDSTNVSVTINLNNINGSGIITLEFASKNDPGMVGSITFKVVTEFGIDILVIDASEDGYGELVSNSLANVFPGTVGIVSRNALNSSIALDNYQMVTWSAGIALPVFHPEEVDALQDYLDGGGNLFINGQNIGNDIFGAGGQSQFAQGFYNNYLHASFVADFGTSFLLNGIPGDPISSNMQFVLNSVYTRSPEDIAPYDSYASSIFIFFNGPKITGIKAATPTHKVVYLGFGFEQIPTDSIWTKNTLLSRIINYFNVEPMVLPTAPVLVSPANSEVIDSLSVLFVWQQSQSQVMKYWLELDTTDQFTSPFVNSEITDTTYLFAGLLSDKNYWWRVKALNPAGWGDYSEVRTFSTLIEGINDDKSQMPTEFSLEQNYPNPFNPSTRISYSIPQESQVSLKIYDVMGREVVELVSERQSPGSYNIEFDAASLSSGTYFYKLTAGDFVSVKKMVLLK
jgi:hypothetical protein